MVRRRGSEWVEHAPIARQLDWCAKAHVRLAVFTHCGSPIERATTHAIDSLVARSARSMASMYELPVTEIACLPARCQARLAPEHD